MNDRQIDLRLLEWTGRVLTIFGQYSKTLTPPMWTAVDCEVEALRAFIREHHLLPDGTKRWEKSERTIAGVTADTFIKAAAELLGAWSTYNTEPGSMSWLLAQTHREVHDKLRDTVKHAESLRAQVRDATKEELEARGCIGTGVCSPAPIRIGSLGDLVSKLEGERDAARKDLDAAQERYQGRINELETELEHYRATDQEVERLAKSAEFDATLDVNVCHAVHVVREKIDRVLRALVLARQQRDEALADLARLCVCPDCGGKGLDGDEEGGTWACEVCDGAGTVEKGVVENLRDALTQAQTDYEGERHARLEAENLAEHWKGRAAAYQKAAGDTDLKLDTLDVELLIGDLRLKRGFHALATRVFHREATRLEGLLNDLREVLSEHAILVEEDDTPATVVKRLLEDLEKLQAELHAPDGVDLQPVQRAKALMSGAELFASSGCRYRLDGDGDLLSLTLGSWVLSTEWWHDVMRPGARLRVYREGVSLAECFKEEPPQKGAAE